MRRATSTEAKQVAPWAGNAVIAFLVRAGAHDRSMQAYSRCVPRQVPGSSAHDCSWCPRHITGR